MKRNALITGASHGIGRAIAEALAEEGCNVGITYCGDREGAEKCAAACRTYGADVEIFHADLRLRADSETLMRDFLGYFKTIGVLINNAGGALKIPSGGFVDMPLDYWDEQVNLNLNAAAYCSQAAIKNMIDYKIPGRIVNIGSIHGSVSWVRRKALPYCAAKGGLEMLTKTVGTEIAKYGINMNCIAPGLIVTNVMSRYSEEEREGFRRKIPAGFFGEPKDIVPMALLLSDVEKSRYIVGQTITIDGGQSIDGVIDCMLDRTLD